jgi:hypothetical protein
MDKFPAHGCVSVAYQFFPKLRQPIGWAAVCESPANVSGAVREQPSPEFRQPIGWIILRELPTRFMRRIHKKQLQQFFRWYIEFLFRGHFCVPFMPETAGSVIAQPSIRSGQHTLAGPGGRSHLPLAYGSARTVEHSVGKNTERLRTVGVPWMVYLQHTSTIEFVMKCSTSDEIQP